MSLPLGPGLLEREMGAPRWGSHGEKRWVLRSSDHVDHAPPHPYKGWMCKCMEIAPRVGADKDLEKM